MRIEEEETPSDRIYRYARSDLTSALEHLANRTGVSLPPKRLFTKEDYVRKLANELMNRQGPRALDAASAKAAEATLKLFPDGEPIVAMCHSHFLKEHIW